MGKIKLPRQVFLWSMSVIYMFAFGSLYVQIPGLYGNEGVLPVRLVEPVVSGDRPLLEQLQASPSLLWLGPHLGLGRPDTMELLCLVGALLSLGAALLEPLRDSLVFLVLWGLYLSLCQVGQTFLRFAWDGLLLEAGFLTVLIAPLHLLRRRSASNHHDAVTFWLARWLLFRLMFGSGVAKLASHCPSWWGLTALSHLFETQGSPTPLAWFAHQLPDWLLRLGTVGVLVSETVLPLLYFAPMRCLRLGAFYLQVVHQATCMLTGNLTPLNLLPLALSFSLLDDDHVSACLGPAKKRLARTWGQTLLAGLILVTELGVWALIIYCVKVLFHLELNWEAGTMSSKTTFTQHQFDELLKAATIPSVWVGVLSLTWELVASMLGCVSVRGCFWKLWALLQWAVFGAAAVGMFAISVVPYTSFEPGTNSRILPELKKISSLVERYRLVGSYALDSTVPGLQGRPEIVLEGSMDKATWTEIEFMYKPGNESAAPPVTSPYQARLDWQLWQAARGPQKHSPWFTSLVHRLLQGKEDVVSLVQADEARYPFSRAPPAYIRASLYSYWWTQPNEDGSRPQQWWRRHYVEEFYPTVQLGDLALEEMLSQHGLKEKVPAQTSPDGTLAQALRQVRGHVGTLPGPLVLWSLSVTVAAICLLKTFLGARKARAPPAEPKAKRPKDQPRPQTKHAPAANLKSQREDSADRRQDSDRSPRKRK
ncbi:lipase maturation factor 2-like [Hypomesus transpacificus]|uniref:lipase maturation factor 2-like n=1 Tax=Hypomesus transpacificus TaxID=137520 RepID=UPI001F08132F|nr:lipase maturation factor 2-like [Hypomesus transpacificus]